MSIYKEFLDKYNYDIRKTKDARWIDQKCTYDVVSIIADCINEYVESTKLEKFTVSDIWHSEYARENVVAIFSKPDPKLEAKNEYDKYFGQPIKLLSYSKILDVKKEKNSYLYSIKNKKILEQIALKPMNALEFLCDYICKVLSDSGLIESFNDFFKIQKKETYKKLRDNFIEFTISNTNINGETECGRIFTKVLNPLAFKLKKLGTEKGRISKNIITLNDLQYNRSNWRDMLVGKDKNITRINHNFVTSQQSQSKAFAIYKVNKAKKTVHKFNDIVFGGKSEVNQDTEIVNATQAHHIFPQSQYPSIADYLENLIMLTPNQHLYMAHPNNKTQYIDRDFQYICLMAKSLKIYNNLMSSDEKIYDFNDYKHVLNTGFETDVFSSVNDLDFATIVDIIDSFYCDELTNNKYNHLIQSNKLSIQSKESK